MGARAGRQWSAGKVAGLARTEWLEVKPAVLPLLRAVQPLIAQCLKNIRAYDGQRLPADDSHIVRSIVWERDGYACVYCGATKALSVDHIVPLSQGGSNDLTNLVTACRPASSTLEEWHARRAAAVPVKRGTRRRMIRLGRRRARS